MKDKILISALEEWCEGQMDAISDAYNYDMNEEEVRSRCKAYNHIVDTYLPDGELERFSDEDIEECIPTIED